MLKGLYSGSSVRRILADRTSGMEAHFSSMIQRQGGKQKEKRHSLLFDGALTDRVLKQNAYEERLLLKRTEYIEKQKRQTLDEHDFYKSRFLLRFLPVVERQNELRKKLFSSVFDLQNSSGEKEITERRRPLSSYPSVQSRISTANVKTQPNRRRSVSAELRFPELHESMDDVLNGYRTQNPETKSVSPTKMRRFQRSWDRETHQNDGLTRNKALSPKERMAERNTKSKCVDFNLSKDGIVENTQHSNNTLNFDYSENSKTEVINNCENFHENVAENNGKSTEHEALVTARSPTETATEKNCRKHSIMLEEGEDGSNSLSKQLKIFQNGRKVPERLIEDLIDSLKNDTTPSNTARFLAKALKSHGDGSFSGEQGTSSGSVSLQLANTSRIHVLSDVKKRQRCEAQRLRIMRTIVLAYDTVWNERVKKIKTVA